MTDKHGDQLHLPNALNALRQILPEGSDNYTRPLPANKTTSSSQPGCAHQVSPWRPQLVLDGFAGHAQASMSVLPR